MGISPDENLRPEQGASVQVPAMDLALREFTFEFSKLIDMGISLVRCLDVLQQMEKNPELKSAINDIGMRVEGGQSLSRAMNEHTDIFDPVYIAMVKAGEVGGVLEATFGRLVDTLKVSDASLEGKSLYADRAQSKEFAWLFGTLLTSGVPMLQALAVSADRFEDPVKEAILESRSLVREGGRLSDGFAKYPDLFNTEFVHIVGVGEQSGSLDYMLMKYAESDALLQ